LRQEQIQIFLPVFVKRLANSYKKAYSGLSPATWWLSLVMLINRSGTMVLPFMTIYLTEKKHFTIGMAGFVLSLFGAGAICGGLIGGRLTDKLGFYPIQLFTLIGGGILFVVLGQIDNYTSICIFTFILSLVNESFRPANAAAIAHYSKEENRTRSYSLNRLSINLGWAAGGTIGGIVASYSYHLLFWIDGLTNISAALLLLAVLSPTRNEATPKKQEKQLTEPSGSPYKDKVYLAFIALTVMYGYCFFQLFTTVPVFFRRHLQLSTFNIGLVMAANGILIALFEMVLIHNLEGKRQNLYYITIGTTLVALSYLVFNFLPGFGSLAIISMLIVTIGEILSMPFMNSFWISRTKPNNRGQYAGLYTIAWSTAQVLGPGTGGQIAEKFGFTALWWVVGSMSIAAAIGFKWLQKVAAP